MGDTGRGPWHVARYLHDQSVTVVGIDLFDAGVRREHVRPPLSAGPRRDGLSMTSLSHFLLIM